MELTYLTDIGNHRSNNEDSVGTFENRSHVKFAIVADGLGGHHGGEVASAMAVAHLGHSFSQTTFTTPTDGLAWLKQAVANENQTILKRAAEFTDLVGMGTTIVCALLFADSFVLANVGDSRGYLLRQGQFVQISEDHSMVNELVKGGVISAEEAKEHPKKNVITQTLGVSDTVQVRARQFQTQSEDLLLLCSDGLTDMIDDRLIATILVQDNALKQKAKQLIESAKAAGGRDNITVLLVAQEKTPQQGATV